MVSVILLLGGPGSGKTTLARNLSAALGLPTHSVGDMIRDNRKTFGENSPFSAQQMTGEKSFAAADIAKLIASAIYTESPTVILDAGPPIDEVLTLLDIKLHMTIFVSCNTQTARKRFLNRKRDEGIDNTISLDELYLMRHSSLFERIRALYERLKKVAPAFTLNGNVDPHLVLYQALLAVQMAEALKKKPLYQITTRCNHHESIARAVVELRSTLGKSDNPIMLRSRQIPSFAAEPLVFLFKPGTNPSEVAISSVCARFFEAGYRLQATSLWNSGHIIRHNAQLAHLGPHYVFWKHSHITQSFLAINPFFSRARASDTYLGPRKIRPGLWIENHDGLGGVINSYVPHLLADFEHTDTNVIAFLFIKDAFGRTSVGDLRKFTLGSSLLGQSSAGSLRWQAANGILDLGFTVRPHNNGMHLSAGGLEAMREIAVWFDVSIWREMGFDMMAFGGYTALDLSIDRPMAEGNSWLFELAENLLIDESRALVEGSISL